MLQSEFIERTGFMPTWDEYKAIEELYYSFEGDKDAFCAYFKAHQTSAMHKVRAIACASFAKERERLMNEKCKKINELRHSLESKRLEDERTISELRNRVFKLENDLKTATEWWNNLQNTCGNLQSKLAEKEDELASALRNVASLKEAIRLLKE